MTITASIVADSYWGSIDQRITTMLLRYPRFIHAEFMTHRVFSRNASSSRAIPVKRLIEDVLVDTAMPIYWGKNQPGMQAREEHDQEVIVGFGSDDFVFGPREQAWMIARDNAVQTARNFDAAGYHKQIVNRLLEPFSHINVVVTATEWDNFFALRRHEDAQPEIKALADAMFEAMEESTPAASHLHLPFISEVKDYSNEEYCKVSAARCARTSYLTHDLKEPDWAKDMELAEKLIGAEPMHYSPFEHQARWMPGEYANFVGWRSYRYCHERGFNF